MTKEVVISVLVGLILGILIAPIFAPVMPWSGQMMNSNQVMGQIDSHFIEQMIPHHEDAITMANLALTRAEHPEIKTLSTDIIKAQTEEITQMKKWYKTWFGNEAPDLNFSMGHGMGIMMHGGILGNETDVEALENAKLFDKEFIEQMIPHHQMAVVMGQMLLYSTSRSEMKQLAENIISAQTKEINQMREWYNAWYKN
ncbi:hypothetical protein A3F19_00325 [Candidatus Nomurabacteria bacterium RIFCSPHIGHO2_12_FULL_37_29]|uniref:DUF305 domain-containing protein n=2 Tax=Parcubacteria group TaxID=1794811 RepID=A0A1G2UQ70_9BACT|nr:MAG: hypothetical protein A3F19_00325 [Candidatus Nomurabacteria bacterium RIFCSPHIGHO2_12_FULL_37_29]OHB11535.1 MAG: hypothetical protein A3H60_01480 [Candidatus Zambryskibacteria bacterium RIFCSPLOWO2_02_FULL_44_12b]